MVLPDLWMDVDTALSEVPVNIMPLLDDTDFKTRETAIAYDAAGMDLVWNFVTTGGAFTQTAVTPTTGGDYDWVHQGDGIYTIEIPASGGSDINNDTDGFGWFTGYATGVLPWRGPVIGFRAAGLNNALIDSAYSTTRGLAGTALPDAAADAAGGLPISDAGGLDLDTQVGTDIDAILTDTNELQTDLTDGGRLDLLIDAIKAVTDALPDSGALTTIASNITAILTDTGELQTDWTDGGRLDLLVDAIKAVTDALPDGGALTTIASNVAAILADTGTDGVVVATATAQAIADEVLKRGVTNVEDTAATGSLTEVILTILNASISGSTLTSHKEADDSTFNTRTVTTDAAAEPVTGIT